MLREVNEKHQIWALGARKCSSAVRGSGQSDTRSDCQRDGWCYLLWCRKTGQQPALRPCVLVTSAFSPPPRWRKTFQLLEDLTALRKSKGDRVRNKDDWLLIKMYKLVPIYIWAGRKITREESIKKMTPALKRFLYILDRGMNIIIVLHNKTIYAPIHPLFSIDYM